MALSSPLRHRTRIRAVSNVARAAADEPPCCVRPIVYGPAGACRGHQNQTKPYSSNRTARTVAKPLPCRLPRTSVLPIISSSHNLSISVLTPPPSAPRPQPWWPRSLLSPHAPSRLAYFVAAPPYLPRPAFSVFQLHPLEKHPHGPKISFLYSLLPLTAGPTPATPHPQPTPAPAPARLPPPVQRRFFFPAHLPCPSTTAGQ